MCVCAPLFYLLNNAWIYYEFIIFVKKDFDVISYPCSFSYDFPSIIWLFCFGFFLESVCTMFYVKQISNCDQFVDCTFSYQRSISDVVAWNRETKAHLSMDWLFESNFLDFDLIHWNRSVDVGKMTMGSKSHTTVLSFYNMRRVLFLLTWGQFAIINSYTYETSHILTKYTNLIYVRGSLCGNSTSLNLDWNHDAKSIASRHTFANSLIAFIIIVLYSKFE